MNIKKTVLKQLLGYNNDVLGLFLRILYYNKQQIDLNDALKLFRSKKKTLLKNLEILKNLNLINYCLSNNVLNILTPIKQPSTENRKKDMFLISCFNSLFMKYPDPFKIDKNGCFKVYKSLTKQYKPNKLFMLIYHHLNCRRNIHMIEEHKIWFRTYLQYQYFLTTKTQTPECWQVFKQMNDAECLDCLIKNKEEYFDLLLNCNGNETIIFEYFNKAITEKHLIDEHLLQRMKNYSIELLNIVNGFNGPERTLNT